MTTKPCTLVLLIGLLLSCIAPISGQINKNEIDQYIHQLSERQGIPGGYLTIIQNGKIVHQKLYGMANLEHQVPMKEESIFRIYSLTKPVIAVGIFQLIEQNKLSLEDTVGKYLTDLPAAWSDISIKYLLTHSSGLPDMAPFMEFQDLTEAEATAKVFAEELHFEVGEKFEYNQTNFWLLHRIIEAVSGETLEDFIIKRQFDGKEGVFFSSDSRDIVQNRVTPYFSFRNGWMQIDHSYSKGRYMYAANGLNVTMERMIEWDEKLRKDKLLRPETKADMWRLFPYKNSSRTFAYSWDMQQVGERPSYGFSGSLVTAYRIFPQDDLSIIFLSNGLKYWYNIDNIVNHIASLVKPELTDLNNYTFESLLQASLQKDKAAWEKHYFTLKNKPAYANQNFERHINDVGYMLINMEKLPLAIQIFTFNTQEFPNSWNVFDSLGEAYERHGDMENAMLNYQKAIDLNTKNDNGNNERLKERIAKMKE